MDTFNKEAANYFDKFVNLMELEGSYQNGKPCNSRNLVNPDTPKVCLKGSPWVSKMQDQMGGQNIVLRGKLQTEDNFHKSNSLFSKFYP